MKTIIGILVLLLTANVYADQILVQPKAGVSAAEVENIVKARGGHTIKKLDAINVHVVDLPSPVDASATAHALSSHPKLKFAEVDKVMAASMTVNDPYFASEWHLTKINAPSAWDYTMGAGVTIAILDTGVYGAHQDLAPNMVPGWNVILNNSDTSDVLGHGTSTSGVAAAATNNGIGVASVSGDSKIMPIKITTDTSNFANWSDAATAIIYAADHGARVANLSYDNPCSSSTILSAAQYLQGKGGVLVVAAGNDSTNTGGSPSPYCVTVSATNSSDAPETWTNFGPSITVAAPGDGIYCTFLNNGSPTYGLCDGTSMSAPIVSGVVALMMSANPQLTAANAISILKSTADDLGAAGFDNYYGYGRVNAGRAVASAVSQASTADTTLPTVAVSSPSAGSAVSGTLSVTVSASDNVGVTRVELYANSALASTDTISPYAFALDTTKYSNGTLSLFAKAYDAAGNVKTSSTVSVTVNNVIPTPTPAPTPIPARDTTPPTVTITGPLNGSIIHITN